MTRADMEEIVDSTFQTVKTLRASKGVDYSDDTDTLSNFKEAAQDLGITIEQAWALYAGKHWKPIIRYCREGKVESEPIESRIDDLITYLILFKGLIIDSKFPTEEEVIPF